MKGAHTLNVMAPSNAFSLSDQNTNNNISSLRLAIAHLKGHTCVLMLYPPIKQIPGVALFQAAVFTIKH